jgi:3-oxoacyl-(acyl-carrier-protein) synthase
MTTTQEREHFARVMVPKIADAVEQYATKLGKEHGTNAAGWWEQDSIGGRVSDRVDTQAVAARVLRAIEDGDPEVLDALPRPNLSGEWADDLTGIQLVTDAVDHALDAHGIEDTEQREAAHETVAEDMFGEICDAYDMAFTDAAQDEITRMCKRHLED